MAPFRGGRVLWGACVTDMAAAAAKRGAERGGVISGVRTRRREIARDVPVAPPG